MGVHIFADKVIYRLCDLLKTHLDQVKKHQQEKMLSDVVFPVRMKILANCIFNKKNPIVVGVDILEGKVYLNTTICVFSKEKITLGRITSLEVDHKSVDKVGPGNKVAIKIQPQNQDQSQIMIGRHFSIEDELLSDLTPQSINLLKKHFYHKICEEEWALVEKLKRVLNIG